MQLLPGAPRRRLGRLPTVVLLQLGIGCLLGIQQAAEPRFPATAATWQGPTVTPGAASCHWHRGGATYWAHCSPIGGRYSFRMEVVCSRQGQELLVASRWVRSPDQLYSDGVSCGPGAAGHVAEVRTTP
jgi:hypothetical protein